VSVQNRQQIFETVPVRHRGTSLDEVALSPELTSFLNHSISHIMS
jgi:hypothetical protein